jgi:hypothetical protein
MIEVRCNFLISQSIRSKECGRQLVEAFLRHFPSHNPKWFGEAEPAHSRFDSNDLPAAFRNWGNSYFILERDDPQVMVHVYFSRSSRHSQIGFIRFQARDEADLAALKMFAREIQQIFDADLAVLHILTPDELNERLAKVKSPVGVKLLKGRVEKEGFATVLWGMTVLQNVSVKIQKCLPDLLWFTIFGRPYVRMFGRDCLLGAPCKSAIELPNDAISLQLTDDLSSNPESWLAFRLAREKCKQHLGLTAFCNDAFQPEPGSKAPKFYFPTDPPI